MKKLLSILTLISGVGALFAQGPAVTSWLQNTSVTGSYYTSGNSTAVGNSILVNCQQVDYSTNYVYVHTKGVPAYATGPFLDGNPSQATDQNAIFKFPLNPQQNTGTLTATTGGNIGVFMNGVALFDYRDGVAWNSTTNALCGGPGNPPCPGGPGTTQNWNRDAVIAERPGFDCSKGHPAMGNYHHHQNPSAYKLDLKVISTICNLYDADGLYAIDSTQHSPLIGYAYDGFPIYGAYGYKNTNGTGGITRMKSGYQLRNITTRTTSPSGASVSAGPAVSTTYPLGYFREDYEFIAHAGQPDYLDEHNGRFCITPEYPGGTYAYFCTVDSNWNSAYPYVVGPTFYGVYANAKVTTISEPVTTYLPVATLNTTPDTVYIAAAANSTNTFSITSNLSWTASSNQNWLSLNNYNGTGNATITLTAQANTGSPRTATVTVTASGAPNRTVTVIQVDAVSLYLSAAPDTIVALPSFSTTNSFNVTANTPWTASSSDSWVGLATNSGSGNAVVGLNIQANTGNTPRYATITLTGTSVANTTVVVKQLAEEPNSLENVAALNKVSVYPNPASNLIAIQVSGLLKDDCRVDLLDVTGRQVLTSTISKGQTIAYFDVQTVYAGVYYVRVSGTQFTSTHAVVIE